MIDKKQLFSMPDKTAAEVVRKEHREAAGARAPDMALLLTEVRAPKPIAKLLRGHIAAQARVFARILELLDIDAKAAKKLPAGPRPPRMPDHVWKLWSRGRSWFPATRAALLEVQKLLEMEDHQVEARLAARLTDAEDGTESREPDPKEESDPLLRILASRRQEQLDTQRMRADLQRLEAEHTKRMNDMRNKAAQDQRDRRR